MPVKPPAAPSIDEMDDGFRTEVATIRGTRYVLREMTADDYQKCLEGAIVEEDVDGRKIRRTDNELLAKLMMGKSLVEPRISVADLWKKPMSVLRKLNEIINDIHFEEVETDEERAKREAEEQEREAEKKGEARG